MKLDKKSQFPGKLFQQIQSYDYRDNFEYEGLIESEAEVLEQLQMSKKQQVGRKRTIMDNISSMGGNPWGRNFKKNVSLYYNDEESRV